MRSDESGQETKEAAIRRFSIRLGKRVNRDSKLAGCVVRPSELSQGETFSSTSRS